MREVGPYDSRTAAAEEHRMPEPLKCVVTVFAGTDEAPTQLVRFAPVASPPDSTWDCEITIYEFSKSDDSSSESSSLATLEPVRIVEIGAKSPQRAVGAGLERFFDDAEGYVLAAAEGDSQDA